MGAHRKNPPDDIAEIIERIVAGEGGSTKILARTIGVSDSLVRAWFDRDDDLKEMYDAAREAHMHKLYSELVQMSRAGKGNVAGIIFTLKARFKQYDQPAPGKLVDVNVNAVSNVMLVRDHGTDQEWQAKCLAQQQGLTALESAPRELQAPQAAPVYLPATDAEPATTEAVVPAPAYYGPPAWNREK